MRKHLTYANVVSTICLFLALGGAAYAGTKLAKGSVGTEQLKAEAVTKGKLHPNSVNSKKVVNGSLTGEDIDAATLGKVPNATNAEYANNAGSATNASHASSAESADHASNADNANHATSADTAANAEKLDGHAPGEFGAVVVSGPNIEFVAEGEFFFSVSGSVEATVFSKATTVLPGRKFRATDFAVHFEGMAEAGLNVHVSFVVNGTAQEVCTVTEVPSTCTPSTTVEIPAGARSPGRPTRRRRSRPDPSSRCASSPADALLGALDGWFVGGRLSEGAPRASRPCSPAAERSESRPGRLMAALAQ